MAREAIFEWEGREYDHNPKSADWYWALGIIAAALTLAAVLFAQYLPAVLIIVGALAIGLHAAKTPPIHRFRIMDDGLIIGTDLYRYDRMRSFAMIEYVEPVDAPPMLSIKTESWFTPHLLIPLEAVDADSLYAFMLERVDEHEHQHTIVDLVSAWMGF